MDIFKIISFNQKDLAKAIGKSEVTVHRWRHEGTNTLNNLKMINATQKHLEKSIQKLEKEKARLIDKLDK